MFIYILFVITLDWVLTLQFKIKIINNLTAFYAKFFWNLWLDNSHSPVKFSEAAHIHIVLWGFWMLQTGFTSIMFEGWLARCKIFGSSLFKFLESVASMLPYFVHFLGKRSLFFLISYLILSGSSPETGKLSKDL